jgi:Late competence development protein ComFB
MLHSIERNPDHPETLIGVKNAYERLVLDHLLEVGADLSAEAQADAACIALNRLPSKYVRNAVDWMFFITPPELERINRAVDMAVTNAIARVLDNPPLEEAV